MYVLCDVHIGITGIPMAILPLRIESSIEYMSHADCMTVITMPFMVACATMYEKLSHEYAVEWICALFKGI